MKVEVSLGEVVDKYTILKIKSLKTSSLTQHLYIKAELKILEKLVKKSKVDPAITQELLQINQELWLVEDQIRECEAKQDFSDRFIQLARSVYRLNDQRFAIKNKINELYNSKLREQKILPEYT